MAAAFPSAWGKRTGDDGVRAGEPGLPRLDGGDDISWMKIGEDGYLHAIIRKRDFLAWPRAQE